MRSRKEEVVEMDFTGDEDRAWWGGAAPGSVLARE